MSASRSAFSFTESHRRGQAHFILKGDTKMKPKAYWLLLVAAIALFCVAGWSGQARKANASESKVIVWEYKIIRANRALTEATLNDMGMYGWELALFDTGERGNGSFGGTYYFKRPK